MSFFASRQILPSSRAIVSIDVSCACRIGSFGIEPPSFSHFLPALYISARLFRHPMSDEAPPNGTRIQSRPSVRPTLTMPVP
jgi:hypothetical protein